EAVIHPHFQQTREWGKNRRGSCWFRTPPIWMSRIVRTWTVWERPGNKQGRGVFRQTVLAVDPQTRAVLGCALQEPFVRTPIPEGEPRSQRHQPAGARDGCLDAHGHPVGSVCWGDDRRPRGRP